MQIDRISVQIKNTSKNKQIERRKINEKTGVSETVMF